MIAVADYGLGNLRSVQKAFEHLGFKCLVTNDSEVMNSAKGLVLPGVGAFDLAMKNLKKCNLIDFVKDWIQRDKPFLGICLGFQMLFEYSEEGSGKTEGLGFFEGSVKRFPKDMDLKVPQIGWNSIDIKKEVPILEGVKNDSHMYFVHSYYVDAKNQGDVLAETKYGIVFDSAVSKSCIFATQFHPEKSGEIGLKIIRNFGNIANKEKLEI